MKKSSSKKSKISLEMVKQTILEGQSENDEKEKFYNHLLAMQGKKFTFIQDLQKRNNDNQKFDSECQLLSQTFQQIPRENHLNITMSKQEKLNLVLSQIQKKYQQIILQDDEENIKNQIMIIEMEQIKRFSKLQINDLLGEYINQQQLIEASLSLNLIQNRDKYIETLHLYDEIKQKIMNQFQQINEARNLIKISRTNITRFYSQILIKTQKQRNIKLTLEKLMIIQKRFLPLLVLINDPKNFNALLFIEQLNQIQNDIEMQSFEGILFFNPQKEQIVQQKVNQFYHKTLSALVESYWIFDEKIFLNALEAQKIMMEANLTENLSEIYVENFVSKIFQKIQKRIYVSLNETLKLDFLYSTESSDEDELIAVLNQIPKDQIQEFFQELYKENQILIHNMHLIRRCQFKSIVESDYFKKQQYGKHCFVSAVDRSLIIKIKKIIEKVWIECKQLPLINFDKILEMISLTIFFLIILKCYLGSQHIEIFNIQEKVVQKYLNFLQKNLQTKLVEQIFSEDLQLFSENLQLRDLCKRLKKNLFRSIYDYFINDSTLPFEHQINYNSQEKISSDQIQHILGYQDHMSQNIKIIENLTVIYDGSKRKIILTESTRQIYQIYIIKLKIMGYGLNKELCCKDFSLSIACYIIQGLSLFLCDFYKRIINEKISLIPLQFDEKKDFDYYINQFDYASEVILFHNRYEDLFNFYQKYNALIKQSELYQKKQDSQEKIQNQQDLKERVTFIESLIYLNYIFEQGQSIYNSQWSEFFEEIKTIVPQIRDSIYKSFIISQKTDQVFQYIQWTKWDEKLKETDEKYRQQTIEKYINWTKDILLQIVNFNIFSEVVIKEFQTIAIDHIQIILFEQFTKIRKMNKEGREAIINDFSSCFDQICIFGSQICFQIPDLLQKHHKNYLQIYFADSEKIVEFLTQNQSKYTFKQLYQLVQISPSLLNISKQKKKEKFHTLFRFYQDGICQNKYE